MIAAGGALGAALRYLIGLAQTRGTMLPGWAGTLIANLAGCLLIGLAAGVSPEDPWSSAFVMTGVCGALTTFSSFALDLAFLCITRAWAEAVTCVGLSLVGGVGLVLLGLQTAAWLGWAA